MRTHEIVDLNNVSADDKVSFQGAEYLVNSIDMETIDGKDIFEIEVRVIPKRGEGLLDGSTKHLADGTSIDSDTNDITDVTIYPAQRCSGCGSFI